MAPNPPDHKLSTLLTNLPSDATAFSLEFFPPKTQAGFTNLQSRLARMATALRPQFVTVTWGAGGSTATASLELAEICQRQLGLPTVLHLTCTNMNKQLVDEALEECRAVGIRNILALRGDPPREEYRDEDEPKKQTTDAQEGDFTWAVDLVRYIRKKYGDYFCIGVAGYPEGHADESHPEPGKQSVDHDLPYLAEKVRASADFIMTQLTYDVDAYRAYEEKLRNYVDKDGTRDIFKSIPIIPGLMPIQSYQVMKRITKLSHAKIPANISKRIEAVRTDDELVKKIGVDILSEIVERIKLIPTHTDLPRILHFYTLNLEKSVAFILERCQLIPPASEPESEDADSEDSDTVVVDGPTSLPINLSKKTRRASSMNAQPHNRVILDQAPVRKSQSRPPGQKSSDLTSEMSVQHEVSGKGSGVPASTPNRAHNLMISEGQGSLGREATWDDFPNGRWGPSHSPAFGEIDGYGPSLKVGPITARKLWGHPTNREDITNLFKRHVTGQLEGVPWSDEIDLAGSTDSTGVLRAETETIRPELLRLIQEKGYWTLASQPAVDGVPNDDPIFGWGPRGGGFVFQKAFVEFFCPKTDWPRLRKKLRDASTTEFSWLKTDAQGNFENSELDSLIRNMNGNSVSNHTPSSSSEGLLGSIKDDYVTSKRTPGTSGVNAVTWGVFRAKEIVSPTIIEPESFRAWGEEAYSIWEEWRRCFPRGSVEEKCLERVKDDVVLVNVVGQCYIGGHHGLGRRLWSTLLDDPVDEQLDREGGGDGGGITVDQQQYHGKPNGTIT